VQAFTSEIWSIQTAYRLCSSSLTAASGVETVLLITKSLMTPQAITQYTIIAKSVVHSKTLLSTEVLEKTARNGAVNGHEAE
jgi:hypothetical protein